MRIPARAWTVWSVGVLAYLVAVLHRTSFGVAGLDAAERFDATPAVLSGFVVLQLLVYALLQVPAGALLDRWGSRRMVVAGALVMATGQLTLALTTDLALAVAARVLVGAGDALTFISVLRIVAAWFPARRVPVFTQLTGMVGQLGQVLSAVLSAVPLAVLLHGPGWATAFGSAAALGVLVAVLVLAVLRDRPPDAGPPPVAPTMREVLDGLRRAWGAPGTRLGLWTHMGTQFSGTVFALLWGVPYLVSAQGLRTGEASVLLTVFVLTSVAVGPVIGELTARHPLRRSWLVLGVISLTAGAWTAVLLAPAPAPRWLLVALVLVLALGGPGSVIGFDYARTFNPSGRLGAAQGIVNVGGFVASVFVVLGIGVVLDVVGQGYSADAFRLAWTVQYAVWVIAVTGILRTRTLARRELAAAGTSVPPLRAALACRRSR